MLPETLAGPGTDLPKSQGSSTRQADQNLLSSESFGSNDVYCSNVYPIAAMC